VEGADAKSAVPVLTSVTAIQASSTRARIWAVFAGVPLATHERLRCRTTSNRRSADQKWQKWEIR